ncbi:unnamed protein product [Ambrosiozyma monospora]|uniref:Unnamed protein product n=1 Tax=Ambrosiozyma monospora TaxID=43982 RepID=A0A9W6YUF7_AMBMO|nr:unnamed protein product [Ambrosiozyma monospora]
MFDFRPHFHRCLTRLLVQPSEGLQLDTTRKAQNLHFTYHINPRTNKCCQITKSLPKEKIDYYLDSQQLIYKFVVVSQNRTLAYKELPGDNLEVQYLSKAGTLRTEVDSNGKVYKEIVTSSDGSVCETYRDDGAGVVFSCCVHANGTIKESEESKITGLKRTVVINAKDNFREEEVILLDGSKKKLLFHGTGCDAIFVSRTLYDAEGRITDVILLK